MDDRGMFTRLADVPVPRRWWWWAALMLMLQRDNRRAHTEMEKVGRDMAEVVVRRWGDVDTSTQAMLKLNRTMVRLTWAVVVLTVIVIGATLYLGLR